MPPRPTAHAPRAPATLVSRDAAEDLETLRRAARNGTYLYLDDTRNDVFRFPSGSSWIVNRDTGWAGGTQTTFDGDGDGEFEVTLFGESVSFVGSAPLPSSGQTFLVSIDGADPFEAEFTQLSNTTVTSASTSSSPFVHRTWYFVNDSRMPAKRPVRITLSRLPRGLGIDYAVLKAHNISALLGSQLMVDNTAPNIQYSGSWSEQRPQAGAVRPGSELDLVEPFGGSVHSSRSVGDSARIVFQGSSISLFSHFSSSGNGTGTLTASYSLDDGPAERRTYTSTANSVVAPNYPLFSLSNLPSSMHTLSFTILESTGNNTSLNLDYLMFQPGYQSLSDLFAGTNGVGSTAGEAQRGPAMAKGSLAGIIVGIIGAVLVLLWVFCCKGPTRFRRVFHRSKRAAGKDGEGSVLDKGKGVSRYSTEFEFKIKSDNSDTAVAPNPTDDSSDPTGKLDLNAILRSNSPPPVHLNTAVMKPLSTAGAGPSYSHSGSRSQSEMQKEERRRPRSTTSLGSSLLNDDDDSDDGGSVDGAVGRITPFVLPAPTEAHSPSIPEKSKSALGDPSLQSTNSAPENIITPFIVPPLPPSVEDHAPAKMRAEKSSTSAMDSKPSPGSSTNGKRPLPHPPTTSSSPSPSPYYYDRKSPDHHHELQSEDHGHETHYQEQRSRRQSIQNELDRLVLLAESLHNHSNDEQQQLSTDELEHQQRILGDIARLVGELDELAREMERGLGEEERPPAYSPQGDLEEGEGEVFRMGLAL